VSFVSLPEPDDEPLEDFLCFLPPVLDFDDPELEPSVPVLDFDDPVLPVSEPDDPVPDLPVSEPCVPEPIDPDWLPLLLGAEPWSWP
jgi:hypothetical protein